MTPIVAIDIESTGLNRWQRQPWEIALIRRDDTGQRTRLIQIRDVDRSMGEPRGLDIGGFYERYHEVPGVAVGPGVEILTAHEAARVVELEVRGAHVIGAVPDFDTHTLQELLRANGCCWMGHYHIIDVETLAVGYLAGRLAAARGDRRPGHGADLVLPWKSEDLSQACGVPPASEEERHTALGDAAWALRLWDAITGGAA